MSTVEQFIWVNLYSLDLSGVKSTVSWIFEDTEFKISEVFKQNEVYKFALRHPVVLKLVHSLNSYIIKTLAN